MGQLGKGRDEMKKFLAMTLVVLITVASGFAETAQKASAITSAAFVNKVAVQKAAAAIKPTPLIAVTGTATAGYLPVFTDAAGDVGNSSFFQAPSGYVGIGTTTPAFNLDIVSTTDPAAITIEGYGNVGVNFIGRRAQGTPTNPLPLAANDNIMTMQGRGYGSTGYSSLSRAYMKFFAAEAWTDAAQGTYISFATTPKGSNNYVNGVPGAAPERLRITDAGWVGIGTTAPGAMLEVNGTAQFDGLVTFAAGQTFPGAILASACAAGSVVTGVTAAGVTCGTIGAGGTAANVAVIEPSPALLQGSITGGPTVGAAQTIFTADADGFYRVSIYMNSPLGGTCPGGSCTGEQIVLTWSDGISTAAQAATTCSLAGPCSSSFSAPIWVANGKPIQLYSQPTGTGTAPTGTFTAHFLVEKL